MGWANCGYDSEGRHIGYAIQSTCDYKGCNKKIDRGLFYACGSMHGENGLDCEKYFCENHLMTVCVDGKRFNLCIDCYDYLYKNHKEYGYNYDEEEFTSQKKK